MNESITLYEVGPRDGLQNESKHIDTEDKLKYIDQLIRAGVKHLELGSFVRPDRVPQMADTAKLFECCLTEYSDVEFIALVPNMKGYEQALKSEVKHIALFTAASNQFNHKNINMSIDESLDQIQGIIKQIKKQKQWVRAYVSTAFACPYEGKMDAKHVAQVVKRVYELGVDQLVLGDTNGVATPKTVSNVLNEVLNFIPKEKLGMHFHDTYGMGILNTHTALLHGIRHFDASSAGLGGCPYAKGASGNVATEDLIYLFDQEGFASGIDLKELIKASKMILTCLDKASQSKNVNRLLAQD